MRFQHFTYLNITENELGRVFSTTHNVSKHWEFKLNDPECQASGTVEQIFEEVRLQEYKALPSRKYCKFFFDLKLSPIEYARFMPLNYEQYHLVEVEVIEADSDILRANKSLLTCRINSDGKLEAGENEIIDDARKYWSGMPDSNLDEEILCVGKFRYTRIIQQAEEKYIPFLRKVN